VRQRTDQNPIKKPVVVDQPVASKPVVDQIAPDPVIKPAINVRKPPVSDITPPAMSNSTGLFGAIFAALAAWLRGRN
jgi:hypothetical protein